ncbi:MAG: hypothetical protein H0V17_10120 [Deltaproteobacteria bacterium]|nr:hypothetical protein [Deltaproteobacteria bacterium]
MAAEWRRLVRGKEFEVEGDEVIVDVGLERSHRVRVTAEIDGLHLEAIVARSAVIIAAPELGRLAWERNRGGSIVGFRLDRKGRLIGEAWVPSIGLERGELELILNHVAAECDRFEHLLTGKDVE